MSRRAGWLVNLSSTLFTVHEHDALRAETKLEAEFVNEKHTLINRGDTFHSGPVLFKKILINIWCLTMCVCLYVSASIYLYLSVCTHTHTYMCMYVSVCIYVSVCALLIYDVINIMIHLTLPEWQVSQNWQSNYAISLDRCNSSNKMIDMSTIFSHHCSQALFPNWYCLLYFSEGNVFPTLSNLFF